MPCALAAFSTSSGESSVWILSAQTRAPDVGGNRVGHRADGEHGVHRAELFRAAPVQNVGISRKHVQHLGRARCAMRRLDVFHQVRKLFRRHVGQRIRFVSRELGAFPAGVNWLRDIRALA